MNEREFYFFVKTDYFKNLVDSNRMIRKMLFEIDVNSKEEAISKKEEIKKLIDSGNQDNCDSYFDKIMQYFDEYERTFDGEVYDSYEELQRAQRHFEKVMTFSSNINNVEKNKILSLINMLKVSEIKSKDRYLAEVVSFWNKADIDYRTIYGIECKDWETSDRIREQIKEIEDILQCGVKNQKDIIDLEDVIRKIEIAEIRDMYLRFTKYQRDTLVRIADSMKQNISFIGKARKECAEIYYAQELLHDTAIYFKLNIEIYEKWFKEIKKEYCTVFGEKYNISSKADEIYYTCISRAKSYEKYLKEKNQTDRGFFGKLITGVKGLVVEGYAEEYNRVTQWGKLLIPDLGTETIEEVNIIRNYYKSNYIKEMQEWEEMLALRKFKYEKPQIVSFCFNEQLRKKENIDKSLFYTWIDELYPSILELPQDNISIDALRNKLTSIYDESYINNEDFFYKIVNDINSFKWRKYSWGNNALDELPNILPADINHCRSWSAEKWNEIIQYIKEFWAYWERASNGVFCYDPDLTGIDFEYEESRKEIVLELSKYLYEVYPSKLNFLQEDRLFLGLEELFSEKMNFYKMIMKENEEAYRFLLPRNYTIVESGLFENNLFVREVVLPESIRKIEKNAFKGCKNLKKVIFKGNRVEEIGMSAFEGCSNLQEICITSRCIIYERAFKNCTSLEQISLISSPVLTEEEEYNQVQQGRIHLWGEEAFSNCIKLRKLERICVSVIGDRCFKDCRNLEKIEGMIYKEVGKQAFEGCNKLIDVKLTYDTSQDTGPWDTLTISIGANAFPNHAYNTFEFYGGFKIPDLNKYTGRIKEVLGKKPYDYDEYMEEQERYSRRYSDFDLADYYGYDSDCYDEDEYSREQFLDDI